MQIAKGLDGIVVDTTAVSQVTPETSSLVYRGYRVQDLADQCRFEEVAHLLLNGELPTARQLETFSRDERSRRNLDRELLQSMLMYPREAHPMDVVRTAVSFLGMKAPHKIDLHEASIDLLAKIPTIIAAWQRIRRGQQPVAPSSELAFSENFLQMVQGHVPGPAVVKAFDVSMTLYAEHSFNASTFTARVVTSTLSDLYSAVVAAIGSLKGPLHGGANEEVMHMLKEIGDPSKAKQWILDALATKKKIMGFGHRVYKKQDSRAPTMDRYARMLAKEKGETKWHEMADIVEQTMIQTKNIYPNLDFPAGVAYYLMGFDIDMFTPLFVMARITGWCAHIMEQSANNRLIRPLAEYVGPGERNVVAIAARG